MKLSQAILLGDTLRKRDPEKWYAAEGSIYNPDGPACGCAIGGALLANGHPADKDAGMVDIFTHWPWLCDGKFTGVAIWELSDKFREVVRGELTLEQLVDWVASIEPPETCSECRSEQPVNEIQVCQECLSNK